MKKKEKTVNYIDNKEFFSAMVVWKKQIIEADEQDDPRPPVNNYIGECFMNIAERLSHKSNFSNYPYKEEMISDGIENCVMYAHNFNPEKSKNPFSYFTQIIYYAFLRRIEKEKKQSTPLDVDKFTPKKKKKKKKETNLDTVLQDESSEDSTNK